MNYTDPLTGLPGEGLLLDRIAQAIRYAARDHRGVGILLVETGPLHAGDNNALPAVMSPKLLRMIAVRMEKVVRGMDTVAYTPEKHFAVVAPGMDSPQHAITVARRLHALLAMPFTIGTVEYRITPNIGIALFPGHGTDPEALLANAAAALAQSHQPGATDMEIYQLATGVAMHLGNSHISVSAEELYDGMQRGELTLYYQPQIKLNDQKILGVEALLRWNHPQHGMLMPRQFIPDARENGSITSLGYWVLRAACRQLRHWQYAGVPLQHVAVNVAQEQLLQKDFPDHLANIMDDVGVTPKALIIEVPSSDITVTGMDVSEAIARLKTMGIRIAIDHVSNIHDLQDKLDITLPDIVKVDVSSIQQFAVAGTDSDAETALEIADKYGIVTIAEGVEKARQVEYLRLSGCQHGQGFLFCEPLPAQAYMPWCH